jgi:DNA-binding transcriptional LysR family regulator
MDLNEILIFAAVVRTGGFTSAAAELGMPKSSVSRKVTDLEERLKARLLQRTTRQVSLTDVGRTYYDYCGRIVAEIEDAERAVSSLQDAPRGLLRVTTGTGAGYLAPILTDYMKRYPEVRIELSRTARVVDLIEERFDVGIRAGALSDSTLIARSLGNVTWFLAATPAYLETRGRPKVPTELTKQDCLPFGGSGAPTIRLENADRSEQISVFPRLLADDTEVLHAAAIAGLGIALLPAFQCVDELRVRRLERVLREWNAPVTPVHIVYPSKRHISLKVSHFIDHLQQRMNPPPWELGALP